MKYLSFAPVVVQSVEKLVPKLKFRIRYEHLKLSSPAGPEGRIRNLRQTVTALFKHERIELNFNRGSEARGYAERLIAEAIRNGDAHQPTMELADFWLNEKQMVHKLFKVLVPRYVDYDTAFTSLHIMPNKCPGVERTRALLELKGNPFPPVVPEEAPRRNQLHNILLDEARKEHVFEKAEKLSKLAMSPTLDNVNEPSKECTSSDISSTEEIDPPIKA